MSLRIRFRGGTLAGRVFAFEDDVERIVIGRDPDRCDVVLPSDMTSVGREHCALERVLARYRLVLNGDNPVLLDGEVAHDGQELPEVAYLRLGAEGPELVAQAVGAQSVPPTEVHVDAGPDLHELVEASAQRSRVTRWAGVVGLLAVVGFLVWALASTTKKVESVKKEQARVSGMLDETTGELDALADSHRVSTSDLRDRLTDVGQKLEGITPEMTSLKEAVAGLGPRMEGLEERLKEKAPQIKRFLKAAATSTYVVVIRDNRGVEHAVATAWVAGEKTLATNGHVAQFFERVSPGGDLEGSTMLVRSPGAEPRDHVVAGVSIHPGFSAFVELWEEYKPTGMSPEGQLRFIQPAGVACDVALLRVELVEDEPLAAPLEIASTESLYAVGAGDVVGLVGYPSEEMSVGGVNLSTPTPTTQIAHVTGVTNYFLATTEPEDCHLVQNSLPVTGGASGSPVMNDQGQVVAVLSAGNVEVSAMGNRAPSAVLVNFAQRADLVRELLDGDPDTPQTPRTQRWKEGISTLMSLATAAEKGAVSYLERYLELVGKDTGTKSTRVQRADGAVTTRLPGRPWAMHDEEVDLAEKGVYVFFVYGLLGQDMDMALLHETDDSTTYGSVTTSDWYGAVRLEADGPAKLRARVAGPPDAEFRFEVWRFPPAGP